MSYIKPLLYEEFDATLTFENWFFYWKFSPSLWVEKLSLIADKNFKMPIWVPIYWGLHHNHDKSVDFGEKLPETDIFQLQKIAIKNNLNLVFILFLGPCPLFPKGGIPTFLNSVPSLNEDGLALNAVESSGEINKVHSFFGPNIFKSFRIFTNHLRARIDDLQVPLKIIGAQCYYYSSGEIISYFLDRSNLFSSQIQKFGEIKKQDTTNETENTGIRMEDIVDEFNKLIEDLYSNQAKKVLKERWMGEVRIGFTGGAPLDVFDRASSSWNYSSRFYPVIMKFIERGLIPTTVLLDPKVKTQGLDDIQRFIIDKTFIETHIDTLALYDRDNSDWLPFFSYILFDKDGTGKDFKDNGLLDYLENHYRYEFKFLDEIASFEEAYDVDKKVYFATGSGLDERSFKTLLKIFFSGGKVVLDKEKLPKELEKYLMRFLIENSLRVQKVQFLTEMLQASIGEGSLIVFSGNDISRHSNVKKISFWENLFNYLSIKRLDIKPEEDIFYHIKFRGPIAGEYDYQELRKIQIWNSSSYKKSVKIKFDSSLFSFRKAHNHQNTEIKEKSDSIEISFLPKGKVTLDFGLFAS